MTKRPGRMIAFVCAALFVACTDSVGPNQSKLPIGLIVSNQVHFRFPASTAQLSASGSATTSAAGDTIAYVSLPPGTAPDGQEATLQNLRTGRGAVVPVGLGGFDPVAVGALAGDTIAIVVRDAGGAVVYSERAAVVLRRPPVVVRTNPQPRKRDVALNSTVVVVFSEPIDSATLTDSAILVRRGSTPVPGTLTFLDSEHVTVQFTPTAQFARSTVYSVAVTQTIRDLDGDALDREFTTEFTTAATAPTYEEYFVEFYGPLTGNNVGDSVSIHATVQVIDGDGNGIEGATVRFMGSIGRVEPETTRAGLDGLTSVHWMLHGQMGGGAGSAELSACASNSPTRCDMPWVVVVVGLSSP